MFFFSWFSGKSRHSKKSRPSKHASLPRSMQPLMCNPGHSPTGENRGAESETKTAASREQLYAAIRESMTRFGILSSSYKFKVLCLDQQGSSYLVMLDLTRVAGDGVHAPAEMEALILQNAMLRYQIAVCAVYWRICEVATARAHSPTFATAVPARATPVLKKETLSHEPIEADEVAAFERALLAASAHSAPPLAPAAKPKASQGLRQPAHPQDFEDTEIAAEALTCPVLSPTQYGDLH